VAQVPAMAQFLSLAWNLEFLHAAGSGKKNKQTNKQNTLMVKSEKTKKGRTAKATSHISFLAAQMDLEKHVTCFFIIGLCFKQHSNRWINSSKLGLCITELYICFSKSVIGLRFW